ncbi:hypothetical protein [Kribbella jiaozuonensis]|uniref:Uncharacterized protein n=1 Tax=Kribbella jiaozuonensis TaxID=2575441 RepID=A0A4U3LVE8_9ACTN|nr:hypothetical protein [Kribbella jiaozuonensis]TKK80128.1 hypothetical protein FDA38_17485 [Kribbella jiaozuonensis]
MTEELLLGILTLLADEREQRIKDSSSEPRTELLLSNAGLGNDVIARAVNKNPDAVRMVIARAKKSVPAKKATARKTTPKAG